MTTKSIVDQFLHNVNERGNDTAALVKRDGEYRSVTWSQMWEEVQDISAGLIALGLAPKDRASIIAHTSLEWVYCDLAIAAAGGIGVPIYTSNLHQEVQYMLDHSDSRFVFAEDAEQVKKCQQERDKLPKIEKIIQLNGDIPGENYDQWIITMDELRELGKGQRSPIEARIQEVSRDDILTIIYTSGTTGLPKGVVLTHGAMVSETEALLKIGTIRHTDIHLIFLPLAHVFARMLAHTWLAAGHIMAFAESFDTVRDNLLEVRPTVLCSVPRLYEKVYAAVIEKGQEAGGIRRKMLERAVQLSTKNGEAEERGEELPFFDKMQFRALKRLVFSKIGEGIMQKLGGRMRFMVSGGAPLPKKIAWFFRDADILLGEGYGLTETCAGTFVNREHNNQIGTVGPPVPGIQVKIAEDGEVLLKGPMILREYWKDPASTAEAISDGWFHTGDIGELDPKTNALRITDRKKDIIVTAGGKNVAPQKIENQLKTHKLVSQAVVYGDRRKYLVVLLTLDPERLAGFAKQHNLPGGYAEWTKHEEVQRHVTNIVDEVNRGLASFETMKHFRILDHDFSVEDGQLTPKLSVKRKVVSRRYGDIMDSMYDPMDRVN